MNDRVRYGDFTGSMRRDVARQKKKLQERNWSARIDGNGVGESAPGTVNSRYNIGSIEQDASEGVERRI